MDSFKLFSHTATRLFPFLRDTLFLGAVFQGFGMLLMEEAERIALEEHGSKKIAVISGRFDISP